MNPLFEKVESQEVSRTDIIKYNVLLNKIGYKLIADPTRPDGSKAELIGIQSIKTSKFIISTHWIRPVAWTAKGVEKALDDYPRLSIPPILHSHKEEVKVKETIELMTKWNMYFFVILPKKNSSKITPMFWIDRYDSIPQECWTLNWWKTKGVSTRLLLKGFKNYQFVDLHGLQLKLNKIFETL